MFEGFLEFSIGGNQFTAADYAWCLKETRMLASHLARELDLSKYQPAYDESNVRVPPPTFEPIDLTPPRRKNYFAPDVDASIMLQDDAIFEALTMIEWVSINQ